MLLSRLKVDTDLILIKELGGFFVMMNTNFEAGETSNSGDFTTANDFRRVTLMRDIESGGSAATATTLRGTKAVLVTSPSGNFTVDEEINQASTGAVGKVVEYDSTNRVLFYIQTRFNDEGVDSNGNLTAFSAQYNDWSIFKLIDNYQLHQLLIV